MLTLDLKQFMFELKDGAIKHVGASNNAATVKLYDIESVDVRGFGDNRIKIAFTVRASSNLPHQAISGN